MAKRQRASPEPPFAPRLIATRPDNVTKPSSVLLSSPPWRRPMLPRPTVTMLSRAGSGTIAITERKKRSVSDSGESLTDQRMGMIASSHKMRLWRMVARNIFALDCIAFVGIADDESSLPKGALIKVKAGVG